MKLNSTKLDSFCTLSIDNRRLTMEFGLVCCRICICLCFFCRSFVLFYCAFDHFQLYQLHVSANQIWLFVYKSTLYFDRNWVESCFEWEQKRMKQKVRQRVSRKRKRGREREREHPAVYMCLYIVYIHTDYGLANAKYKWKAALRQRIKIEREQPTNIWALSTVINCVRTGVYKIKEKWFQCCLSHDYLSLCWNKKVPHCIVYIYKLLNHVKEEKREIKNKKRPKKRANSEEMKEQKKGWRKGK